MGKLSRIADVQISLGTLAISERSFNDILALTSDPDTGLTPGNRVMVITGADELLDAGVEDGAPIYRLAQAVFSQTPHVRQLYIGYQELGDTPETVTEALAACAQEAPGYWYGLLLDTRDDADVREAAAWAEANERLFGTATNDPDVIGPADTDIASALYELNYMRSFVCFTTEADTEFPEAALMGERFTYYPGSESFANVQLSGITSDNLSEGDYQFARQKNVTTFERFRNFSITQGGRVAGGEWIDVIRLRDQLVESIKVSVVGAIIRATNSTGKIPFTDDGIQIIVNAIRQPLDLNIRRGGIAPEELDANGDVIPSYKVEYPLAAEISTNDKANRILRDVNFTARLAGAIHTTEIRGSLVYDYAAG